MTKILSVLCDLCYNNLMPQKRQDPIQRILNRVETPLDENQCWLQTSGTFDKDGYGRVWIHPTNRGSHQVMWEAHNAEPIPAGMLVAHACDNPACVNPAHLSLATNAENQRQKAERNRANGAGSILSEADVKIIKRRLTSGDSCVKISKDYPVSYDTIWKIKAGKNWGWV